MFEFFVSKKDILPVVWRPLFPTNVFVAPLAAGSNNLKKIENVKRNSSINTNVFFVVVPEMWKEGGIFVSVHLI